MYDLLKTEKIFFQILPNVQLICLLHVLIEYQFSSEGFFLLVRTLNSTCFFLLSTQQELNKVYLFLSFSLQHAFS